MSKRLFLKKETGSAAAQIVRYAVVGVLSNLLGYSIYLAVTWLWLEPKLAVTVLYPVGVISAYFGHARYSFSYQGRITRGLWRYIVAHAAGYGVNILMLTVFSDMMRFPHQAVQAAAILVVAGMLFLLFKYFVFAKPKQPGNCPC